MYKEFEGILTFYLADDHKQLEAYIAIMPFYQDIAIDNTCKSFQAAWISLQHYGRENALLFMKKLLLSRQMT